MEETINSPLRNREKLKDHYTCELPNEFLQRPRALKNDRKFLNDFTSIVESNIANENFGVEDICKEIGISLMELYRKIKILLSTNINDYTLNVRLRLQKVKFLLLNEDLSISEVASKVALPPNPIFLMYSNPKLAPHQKPLRKMTGFCQTC